MYEFVYKISPVDENQSISCLVNTSNQTYVNNTSLFNHPQTHKNVVSYSNSCVNLIHCF